MNSAIGALLGMAIAIVLIIRKVSPVYSLLAGALAGGLLAGYGLEGTVTSMISGVKDITPAVLRILAAGILSGAMIKTGAAASISRGIVGKLGQKHVCLALALSAMLLTSVGVFVDVAVITVAPIALELGRKTRMSGGRLLLAMIAGGKCGNIISPNPNTIVSAENFGAPLPSVMGAGVIPAIIGLVIAVYVIIPLMPSSGAPFADVSDEKQDDAPVPSFLAAIAGPVLSVALLSLRPIAGVVIDPLIALPAGGITCILATRKWKESGTCIKYGLEKMSVVAVLLVGTGTLAGIIKDSSIRDVLVAALSGWSMGGVVLAPLASVLMSAATASSTAGATIASASFSGVVLDAGIPAVWGAAMTNAGATVLDHLPHGSFFHATGGSVGMQLQQRLRLIPYESLVGLSLTLLSLASYLIAG